MVQAAEAPVSFAGLTELGSPPSGVEPPPPTDYPRQTSLHALLAQTATNYPDNVALIFNDQKLSYREVHETAN